MFNKSYLSMFFTCEKCVLKYFIIVALIENVSPESLRKHFNFPINQDKTQRLAGI